MSETASTEAASESLSTDAGASDSGSASEGSATGTQTDAGALASGTDSGLEARVRSEQSRADRAEARARELEAQLASRSEGTDPGQSATGVTAQDIHSAMQMYASVESIKSEFPEADTALFGDLSQYGSVDALRATAQRSHEARKAARDAMRAEVEAELRQKYAAQLGELREEEPPSGGDAPGGLPTVAQLNAMSFEERDEFEKANPGVIRRILAEQSPKALMGGMRD